MFPAMPYVKELPRCETCDAPACHFYVDLEEADPIGPRPIRTDDGLSEAQVYDRQWKVRAHHARCAIHPGAASRYYRDGTLEADGRPVGRWK